MAPGWARGTGGGGGGGILAWSHKWSSAAVAGPMKSLIPTHLELYWAHPSCYASDKPAWERVDGGFYENVFWWQMHLFLWLCMQTRLARKGEEPPHPPPPHRLGQSRSPVRRWETSCPDAGPRAWASGSAVGSCHICGSRGKIFHTRERPADSLAAPPPPSPSCPALQPHARAGVYFWKPVPG